MATAVLRACETESPWESDGHRSLCRVRGRRAALRSTSGFICLRQAAELNRDSRHSWLVVSISKGTTGTSAILGWFQFRNKKSERLKPADEALMTCVLSVGLVKPAVMCSPEGLMSGWACTLASDVERSASFRCISWQICSKTSDGRKDLYDTQKQKSTAEIVVDVVAYFSTFLRPLIAWKL